MVTDYFNDRGSAENPHVVGELQQRVVHRLAELGVFVLGSTYAVVHRDREQHEQVDVLHRLDSGGDAAAALFAEKGFDNTSLQDVATAVGVTKAGLYHYFPTKHALFEAIVLDTLRDLHAGAVAAIADKKANGGRRGATAKALKSLGDHPDGGEVTVNEGRYGPYVKWGKINATIPKGKDPQAITMEEAVPLLAARAEKAGIKKPAKKAAAKKTAAKKTTAKSKTATKKTASSKKTAEAEKSDS